MKPLKTNKTIIYGNEEPPRKNQSPSHKIKYAGKAKIDNIKELISLMFNDNKSALSKLQKTINLVSLKYNYLIYYLAYKEPKG